VIRLAVESMRPALGTGIAGAGMRYTAAAVFVWLLILPITPGRLFKLRASPPADVLQSHTRGSGGLRPNRNHDEPRAGAKLFSEGDPARNVFIICYGQVKVSSTSRDGKTMILKIAGPGDVMGLSAVLANVPMRSRPKRLNLPGPRPSANRSSSNSSAGMASRRCTPRSRFPEST